MATTQPVRLPQSGRWKGQDFAQLLCDHGSTSYQSQGIGSQEEMVCSRGQSVGIRGRGTSEQLSLTPPCAAE